MEVPNPSLSLQEVVRRLTELATSDLQIFRAELNDALRQFGDELKVAWYRINEELAVLRVSVTAHNFVQAIYIGSQAALRKHLPSLLIATGAALIVGGLVLSHVSVAIAASSSTLAFAGAASSTGAGFALATTSGTISAATAGTAVGAGALTTCPTGSTIAVATLKGAALKAGVASGGKAAIMATATGGKAAAASFCVKGFSFAAGASIKGSLLLTLGGPVGLAAVGTGVYLLYRKDDPNGPGPPPATPAAPLPLEANNVRGGNEASIAGLNNLHEMIQLRAAQIQPPATLAETTALDIQQRGAQQEDAYTRRRITQRAQLLQDITEETSNSQRRTDRIVMPPGFDPINFGAGPSSQPWTNNGLDF